MDLWDCYNGLLLSEDVSRLRKLIVRNNLYRQVQNVPGSVVECGVFKGAGWMFWLKLVSIYSHGELRRVIGFDTFEAFSDELLDYERESAKSFVQEADFHESDPVLLMEAMYRAGFRNGELVKGEVSETIPKFCKDNTGLRFALVNLDFDTYEGTRIALENFVSFMSPGGIFVLDEYGKSCWGESDAVDEFIREHGWTLKSVPFSNQPSAYLVKE